MKNILITLIIAVLSATASAFEFEQGRIDIPEGFEGPTTENMGPHTSVVAFVKRHPNKETGTLLQITSWNPGQKFPELSMDQLKEGAANYLLQFIGGIERKRTTFKKSSIEYVSISTVPAAKITWTGVASDRAMTGTMYCLIYQSNIISLHTQDFVEYGHKDIDSAVLAFESIQLKR